MKRNTQGFDGILTYATSSKANVAAKTELSSRAFCLNTSGCFNCNLVCLADTDNCAIQSSAALSLE